MRAKFHHLAIAVVDFEQSLRFYRDGLGLQVVFDEFLERDWQRLLRSPCRRIREVALADPEDPHAGVIALAVFEDGIDRRPAAGPPVGVSHLAFNIASDEVVKRLARLGYPAHGEGETLLGGVKLHVSFVCDPNGIVVELARAVDA
jgi:glyoxylase I family protein